MTADDVIQLLGLQPHPEGGHYVETFRDSAVDANGRSYLQVFNEAAAWAQSEYAAALYQGNAISADDRLAVAQQMSALIGLPTEYIAEQSLRIDSWDFGDLLLAKDAMRTGHLDARAKGLLADYKDKRPPGNDPSMSGGGKGGRSTGEVLEEYYRQASASRD